MATVIHEKRKLSPLKLFEVLQKEYLIAKLRSKIYPKINDREYWKKCMLRKQIKIQDIAVRNHLPSMFSDPKIMLEYELRFNGQMGYPNFDYKDQAEYDKLYKSDVLNYYHNGSEVRINISDTEVICGVIEGYNFEKSTVLVMVDNKEDIYHSEIVTRIL